ncbi:MAG: hypothetical protein IJA36_07215 [Lachnospiraceae bacterium]|nr:hypothetical protein [Lachnospiraceae bacterium]
MKKISQLIVILMAAVMMVGCTGTSVAEQGNAVQIEKDGTITGSLVDVLDQSYYDAEELKSMIVDEIAGANNTQGSTVVELSDYKCDDAGNVKVKIKYTNSDAYMSFNGKTFFSGDAVTAKDTYGLNGNFLDVQDGKITTDEAVVSEDAKVVVLSENLNVYVPGKIVAITDNVEITGKKSASVKLADENGEEELAYIVYK